MDRKIRVTFDLSKKYKQEKIDIRKIRVKESTVEERCTINY